MRQMTMCLRLLWWIGWLACGSLPVFGQQPSGSRTQIYLIHADVWADEDGDSTVQRQLQGNVRLRHDSVFLFCDTATILGNDVRASGNTSMVQGDSLKIFADTLTYDGDTGIAYLRGRVLLINGAQRLRTDSLRYDSGSKVATYLSGAYLENGNTRMFSLKGDYHVQSETIYFKDSVRVQDPRFRLKSDSLMYRVDEKRAYFTGPTLIRQRKADLYCERGYYDLGVQEGWFFGNAQFRDSTRTATAERMFYKANPEQFTLFGEASYEDDQRMARGDTLDYKPDSGDFLIQGHGFFQDAGRTMSAGSIRYNEKTERLQTRGRTRVKDGAQVLEADLVESADSSDLALARGHVIWQDTSMLVTLTCDSARYQRSTGYFLGMGNPPLLTRVLDGDTLYLVADLIRSDRGVGADTTRRIQAYHHVLLYKSDLQASCDSLAYAEVDSMFRFYGQPVIWADTSQFSADTIGLRMGKKDIDSMMLWRKALIINAPDEPYYSQIKGRSILASFVQGDLARMDVIGNAESVYYARDEGGQYLGVNTSACSEMVLFFEDNQVVDIFYLRDPQSVMYPMNQVDHATLRLDGFQWRADERPVGLDDLLRRWHVFHDMGGGGE